MNVAEFVEIFTEPVQNLTAETEEGLASAALLEEVLGAEKTTLTGVVRQTVSGIKRDLARTRGVVKKATGYSFQVILSFFSLSHHGISFFSAFAKVFFLLFFTFLCIFIFDFLFRISLFSSLFHSSLPSPLHLDLTFLPSLPTSSHLPST